MQSHCLLNITVSLSVTQLWQQHWILGFQTGVCSSSLSVCKFVVQTFCNEMCALNLFRLLRYTMTKTTAVLFILFFSLAFKLEEPVSNIFVSNCQKIVKSLFVNG